MRRLKLLWVWCAVNAHLLGVGHAMKMMNSRIAALLELMQKMSSGEFENLCLGGVMLCDCECGA